MKGMIATNINIKTFLFISKDIFNLRLCNGGLGVQSTLEVVDSAFIGSWTSVADEVFNQLYKIVMTNTDGDGDSHVMTMGLLQNLNMIQNVKNSAVELKNYICVDNKYKMWDHQTHSILIDGEGSMSEVLDILINSRKFHGRLGKFHEG